jgi:signal transduction histidine kinase
MVLVEPNNSPETLPAPTSTPVLRPGQSALVPEAAYESVRYPIGASNNPSGYVQLDAPAASGEQILAAMRRALLLAGLGATLVAAIAGLLVGRSLTAPVLALSESATRMSSGDLSARAPERGAGEIGLLARQFNHMASSLQASFQAISTERDTLRRFIADASHELRTPITALGNFVELLQGPAADDQAAREEFLSESQKQVRRMEWIAGNLLDLSRMDAGLIQLDLHPQDLGDLLEAAAGPFLPRAQEKGIRLVIDPPSPPVNISCDRARMEMALGNLLDNALKFTPAGGLVRLSGSSSEQGIRITVEDDGAGIETDDLPFIFERFYRGQATTDGSGLGLSIVKSIIQAHGGQVSIESQPGQGTKATIDFPLS